MENATEYLDSIQQALQSLSSAADKCQATYTQQPGADVHSLCAREAARNALVLGAHRFLQTAQGPVDAARTCVGQTAHLGSVRALLEAGVFDKLPADGTPQTPEELAQKLGVDESLLGRLLRNAAVYGPLEATEEGTYRHTRFSLAYRRPEIGGIFRFHMDEHVPALLKLHEFLRATAWRTPASQSHNPYTHAHSSTGRTMFAVLAAHPQRLQAFNDGMMLQAATASCMIDLFPFREELSVGTDEASVDTPQRVLAVDIGGGTGKAIARIRQLAGALPGRYILQDQAHVVNGLDQSAAYLEGVESMAHDFFTPQPVVGARVYLLRRCLHNWPEEDVVKILGNTAVAMGAHSRLLLEEIIVPERGVGVEEGWMDLIMMSLGAKQRTLREWRGVLGRAGMEVVRIYQEDGVCQALIEARLRVAE
ncbi:O-methyltransferase [Aspergillus mulundensis]|uniref:O-methyltransferase n=1 Tax=Aspergillus mulundensis TaxID=1810919 RepID=A0A3D8QVP3_9EURO|nr:O-methyltransferase [Aspergillus mulundensis]RDW65923.1 O-methyltransferase [Aspergillus mulundensis]